MKKILKYSIIGGCALLLLLVAAYLVYNDKYSASTLVQGTEICDNGIDDNNNSLVDECWDPGKSPYNPSRTLYVSTAGDDNSSGTAENQPFGTINRATSIAEAGDIILVAPGTYYEDVVFANSGTPEKPIILIAKDKNNRPVVSNTNPPNSSFRGIKPMGNTVIDSIIVDGVKTVTPSGHNLGGMGIQMDSGNIENILVTNCVIKNTTEALRATEGKRLIVRNTQAYGNEDGFLISAKGEDLFVDTLFENVESFDSPYRDANNDGFAIEGKYGHHVLRNCSAHGFVDAGLDIKSNNIIVDGFTSYNNEIGMKIWRSATIQNSIAYKNHSVNYDMGAEDSSGINWKFVNNINLDGVIKIEKGPYYSDNNSTLPGTNVTPQTVKISHNIFYKTSFQIDDRFSETTKKFLEAGDHNLFYESEYAKAPDDTSIIAKPEFENYSGSISAVQDLRLKAGSPGINSGAASMQVFSPLRDKDRKYRLAETAIDIGPYEFNSIAPPPDEEDDEDDSQSNPNNKPPVFLSSRLYSVEINKKIQIEVRTKDPEGKEVTLSFENMPSGMTLDKNILTWRPGTIQAGSYYIIVRAKDVNDATSRQIIAVRVTKPVGIIEQRVVNYRMNSNKEVEFQVCRNRFYTSRFIEMFRFGDGSPSLFIEEPKRSLCSSWYEHSYVKEKDYQLTLFLCEKNSDGKLKCLPNLVNLVPKR